jgi:transposase
MAGISQIKIKESLETLKKLLNEQKNSDSFQKIQVLYLLKSEQIKTITEVAQIVGKHRVTVQGWLRIYQQEGIEDLLSNKMGEKGRKSLIPESIIEQLREKILNESSLKSYKEIQLWLENKLGQEINYDVVYYLVRKKLKVSLREKKPQNNLVNCYFKPLVKVCVHS